MQRFIGLNQAIMASLHELGARTGWFPDCLHAHDWHTSLLPFMIREHGGAGAWSKLGSALSIHNIAYRARALAASCGTRASMAASMPTCLSSA